MPAGWAAGPASSRWVRAAPGAGGGRGEGEPSPGRVPQHPAAGGRGCPGSRGLFSLPPPSALKHRRAEPSAPGSARRRRRAEGPGGHAAPGGFPWGEGSRRGCRRPVLSFPGHVPLAVPDPRVPGAPRRCSRRAGRGNPRASRGGADRWLRASGGSCLGQRRGQPELGLAARPAPRRERGRGMFSAPSVPNFSPAAVPRSPPAGTGVSAGGSALGRLGWARLGWAGRQGARGGRTGGLG